MYIQTHIFAILVFFAQYALSSLPCALRDYPYGSVCVCNDSYCDALDADDVHPKGPAEFILVSSTKGGLRFSLTKGEFTERSQVFIINDYEDNFEQRRFQPTVLLRERRSEQISENIEIKINRSLTYQKIVGFGGAFTGAVSYNLDKISDELKNKVYESYFSKTTGIGYNFLRLSIGGCDFDLQPWAYNEMPILDNQLSNFTKLDPRDERKIEQIKDLMKISNNFDIKFFGSAWSPPVWMKDNGDWTGYSNLKPEYYDTWAEYHIKYLELMAAKNISIWAISTGNEPLNGAVAWLFVHFMSLGWTPKNQGKWVGKNLGPALRNSKFKNVKLFGNDDQRYTFPYWFKGMEKGHSNSTSYLDGLAVHWYWDDIFAPSLLDETHNLYKDKLILNTESCAGDKPWETHGPELGSWERAEKYIHAYIEDLQHWVNGWIDWNIILDENGGPNYVKNFVDSPVIINVTSGQEIYKQPMFYAIGHFSKFLTEGSVRVDAQVSNSHVESVAFITPEDEMVVIIYNSKGTAINVTIEDNVRGQIKVQIPRRSIHTLIYK